MRRATSRGVGLSRADDRNACDRDGSAEVGTADHRHFESMPVRRTSPLTGSNLMKPTQRGSVVGVRLSASDLSMNTLIRTGWAPAPSIPSIARTIAIAASRKSISSFSFPETMLCWIFEIDAADCGGKEKWTWMLRRRPGRRPTRRPAAGADLSAAAPTLAVYGDRARRARARTAHHRGRARGDRRGAVGRLRALATGAKRPERRWSNREGGEAQKFFPRNP
jgi:hypothetical protein